ncbi:phosphoribosylglycinamide formyltransferase [Limnoglobus roseus]|uniref:Phosphoribosylglycinamide formyltransferase n=1 Tax=Limnoglobus roseus TaxID=2598579 RepID=A0A5C1A591_9BACT|nr:phosphoribosylglycinamide formyltransferase [Limnoglobus roseus]QEL14299.1 phosphoribosylglycinamide formyltransferase [Limnoglobus roseus]
MRLVVLISGSGTTLQNFIDRTRDGRLDATILGVISSKPGVLGVERARAAGLPVAFVEPKPRDTFSERVFDVVRTFSPDLVCLAGWLHLVTIPPDFRRKVVNIHPSLLPAFGGKGMYGHHVHEAVLKAGEPVSGCTVHYADDTYDTGPIILQRSVPVLSDDTPDALAKRVFEAECEAYPEAIRLLGGSNNHQRTDT